MLPFSSVNVLEEATMDGRECIGGPPCRSCEVGKGGDGIGNGWIVFVIFGEMDVDCVTEGCDLLLMVGVLWM